MVSTVAGIHLGIDTHANRPAGNTVPDASFYSCSTHGLIYKSNYAGNSWATWATLGGAGFTDPMTTRGDIIVRDAANATARLAKGSAGTFLSSDGTDVAYAAVTDALLSTSDVTTNNATTSKHGFLKKLSNVSTEYMSGTGVFSTPAGGSAGGLSGVLEQHTASASATLDFTACISSTYDEYVFIATNLVPATDNVTCKLLVSTDGGSTWASTTYTYAEDESASDANTLSVAFSNGTSSLLLAGARVGIGTGTGKALSFKLELSDPLNASLWKSFRWRGSFVRTGGTTSLFPDGFGQWQTATAVNAIRFQMSSGNIASGTIRVYGIAKT